MKCSNGACESDLSKDDSVNQTKAKTGKIVNSIVVIDDIETSVIRCSRCGFPVSMPGNIDCTIHESCGKNKTEPDNCHVMCPHYC